MAIGLQNLPKASRSLHHVEAGLSATVSRLLIPAYGRLVERPDSGNVVAQAADLKVAACLLWLTGRSGVYGRYYDILTGRIEFYDQQMRRFLPLVG